MEDSGEGEDAGAGRAPGGEVSGGAAGPGAERRALLGALLPGASALAAAGCAQFPKLPPPGAGVPIEADPLFREAMASAPVLPGNEVTPLFNGLQAFSGLFRGVEGARDHVNLEFYIFQDVGLPGTEGGPSLFELLRRKLRQGVAVNVVYDGFGSKDTPPEDLGALRAAGANLLAFNPVNPLEARGGWRPNRRDHRKIAVVDGRVGMTGGINLDHVYENSCRRAAAGIQIASTEDACWADVAIRVEGPAVAALQRLFFETWAKQGGGPLPARDWFPPPTGSGRTRMRVLGSAPHEGRPRFYVARMAAIAEARRRIWLCAGYFVPTEREHAELARAARRGVDVRLLLPGVTGEPATLAAQRASYGPLLDAGVRVWEVRNSVLHAKLGVIDDAWSWVGSSNLDRRSVAWNNEVDAILLERGSAEAMAASMERVMAHAVPVTLEDWRQRGARQRLRELLALPVLDLL